MVSQPFNLDNSYRCRRDGMVLIFGECISTIILRIVDGARWGIHGRSCCDLPGGERRFFRGCFPDRLSLQESCAHENPFKAVNTINQLSSFDF